MQTENLNQVITTAYAVELRGVKLYEKLKSKDEIFSQILAIKTSGLELLKSYVDELNLAEQDCYFDKFEEINLEDCLIKAINYELELNSFYERLTDGIDNEEIRDIFFRLWATSNNEYLPALKTKLKFELQLNKETEFKPQDKCDDDKKETKQSNGFGDMGGFEGFNAKFKEISGLVEKIASGRGNQTDILELINNPRFSFFSGLVAGGMTGMFINKMINKDENV